MLKNILKEFQGLKIISADHHALAFEQPQISWQFKI